MCKILLGIFKRFKKITIIFIISCIVLLFVIKKNHPKLNANKISSEICLELFQEHGNNKLIEMVSRWTSPTNETYTDPQLTQDVKLSCDNFLAKQNYFLNLNRTEEETNLSIAFTILTYKSASQVERLLRTIYRPWNYYCIHVDQKSSKELFDAIDELVRCLNKKYNNIINTLNRVKVQWGTMSVLTADLNCMKELYDRYKDWKYLINLTGQEFPLKTNAELAKILTAYKGANNVEGLYRNRNEDRVPTIRMPFPIVWYKGSVHITVNRHFIEYIFKSPKSKIILDALKDRLIPDEQFFSTLNHNPQLRIAGSFVGDPEDPWIPFMNRYKNWGSLPCKSKYVVRGICIWGVGDLYHLIKTPHLFANKFHEDFQLATLKCLEQWYYEKVNKEIASGHISINETFYSSLSFVKHQYIARVN